MKYIALIAVMAILLLEVSGALPKSSVGGPLTLMLILLLAMLAVGIHEAWSSKRGVLGWIVSIVAAVVGGFVGASAGGMTTEMILSHLNLGVSLAASGHPLLNVMSAAMILTLAGSWAALWIVNRFRRSASGYIQRPSPTASDRAGPYNGFGQTTEQTSTSRVH